LIRKYGQTSIKYLLNAFATNRYQLHISVLGKKPLSSLKDFSTLVVSDPECDFSELPLHRPG